MTWNEILNEIDEVDNKLLIPKEESIEKRSLKETFKTMTDNDFEIFYEVLKERDDYKQRIYKANILLKELNIKLKDILKFAIDIKEIGDIQKILQGGDE